MSALERSTRDEILWVITLSEEDGRVRTFLDGTYHEGDLEGVSAGGWDELFVNPEAA